MPLSGLLVYRCKPDAKLRVKGRGDTVRIMGGLPDLPTLEVVVLREDVPQLIADLQAAIGVQHGNDRLDCDLPGGPGVPRDDRGVVLEGA